MNCLPQPGVDVERSGPVSSTPVDDDGADVAIIQSDREASRRAAKHVNVIFALRREPAAREVVLQGPGLTSTLLLDEGLLAGVVGDRELIGGVVGVALHDESVVSVLISAT